MVWTSGSCNSWYLNPDGTNRSLYPGYAFEYVLRTRYFRSADYEMVPAAKVHRSHDVAEPAGGKGLRPVPAG